MTATTCPDFTSTVLASRTTPMTIKRLDVKPGDVFHDGGARYLVLNAGLSDNPPYGIRQNLTIAALSHADTRGILAPWTTGLTVDFFRTQDATVEAPLPNVRRWWIATALDDNGRFQSANGYQEKADCARCAHPHSDPARRNNTPCMAAQAHAMNDTHAWKNSRHRLDAPRTYYVLPVLADHPNDARTGRPTPCATGCAPSATCNPRPRTAGAHPNNLPGRGNSPPRPAPAAPGSAAHRRNGPPRPQVLGLTTRSGPASLGG